MAIRPLILNPAAALAVCVLLAGCATAPTPDASAPQGSEPEGSAPEGPAPEGAAPEGAPAPQQQQQEQQPADAKPAQEPAADEPAADARGGQAAKRESEIDGELKGDNLYRLLVADLAGRKGDVGTALQGYLETARESSDPRVAERATRLAVYAGRPDAALEAARRWVELAPDSRDAHAALARMHLRSGDSQAALEHLRRVIDVADGGPEAGLREVASLLNDTGQPGAALNVMETLVAAYPQVAIGHYTLARLAHRTDADERALRHVDRAITLDPELTRARILRARIAIDRGDAGAALRRLETAIEQRPDDRGLAVGYARLLVETDRDQHAVRVLQRTFERFGDDANAVYQLALLAMQLEAYDDATIYLERLVAMGQRTATAHYYLGRIAQQREQWTRALRHYIKVGSGEHRFDAELRAAVCMAEAGRLDEARVHLERLASRYQQTRASVRVTRTRAQVERIAGNPEEALRVLGNAVEQNPDNPELRYARALMAAQLDRFELARGDLERVLQQEPDNARALNALGYMLADRSLELKRAKSMIERALEQNPQDAATLDSMGWVLYRLGRNQEALSYLRSAWERSPDAEIAAHLGEVLWVSGERERARAIWSRGEELAPGNDVLQETVERLAP